MHGALSCACIGQRDGGRHGYKNLVVSGGTYSHFWDSLDRCIQQRKPAPFNGLICFKTTNTKDQSQRQLDGHILEINDHVLYSCTQRPYVYVLQR